MQTKRRKFFILLLVMIFMFSSTVSAYASYVGSVNSNKYHYWNCYWAGQIHSNNEIVFSSPEDAAVHGYVPCKVCRPPYSSPSYNQPTYSPPNIYNDIILRPGFNVCINNIIVNYTSNKYYPVDIGGIVFIPLTSEIMKTCKLQGTWDKTNGFNLSTNANLSGKAPDSAYFGNSDIYSGKIKKPSFPVVINGTNLNITSSKYYPVDIAGIVFIPLTNEVISTLGMKGGWTAATGLNIANVNYTNYNNTQATPPVISNSYCRVYVQAILTLDVGESQTITVSTSVDNVGVNIAANYDESAIDVEWSEWDGNQIDMTVTGLSEGESDIEITYLDEYDNVLDSTWCDVFVYQNEGAQKYLNKK